MIIENIRRIAPIVLIFGASVVCIYGVWRMKPVDEEGAAEIGTIPTNFDELRAMSNQLLAYKNRHPLFTVGFFSLVYLFKQTFAIPGSFFMNVTSGALFGTINGTIICSLLNSTGATLCYVLSSIFARPLLPDSMKRRIDKLRERLEPRSGSLLLTLISARVFPFTPHWFLNMASPFVGIPVAAHATSVLVGQLPYNLLCVRAGTVIATIRSSADVLNGATMAQLAAISALLFGASRFMSKRKEAQTIEKNLID